MAYTCPRLCSGLTAIKRMLIGPPPPTPPPGPTSFWRSRRRPVTLGQPGRGLPMGAAAQRHDVARRVASPPTRAAIPAVHFWADRDTTVGLRAVKRFVAA